MDKSQSARHWSAIAGNVHGWNNEQSAEGSLNLNVLAGRGGRVLIAVDGTATESKSTALPSDAKTIDV
jgi:hypothetical protein